MRRILIIFYLIFTINIFSHPHMQILYRTEFLFNEEKLDGVWMEWEFDEYFSADILLSFDLDKNRVFNKKETEDIYNNAFINLEEYSYFTYIRVGDERFSPDKIDTLEVKVRENYVIYRFYIPLNRVESRDFYLSVYDFTYFCACFSQEENPVTFLNGNGLKPEYKLEVNEEYPIYFNPYAGPDDNRVYSKWEEGLVEVAIEEINVKY